MLRGMLRVIGVRGHAAVLALLLVGLLGASSASADYEVVPGCTIVEYPTPVHHTSCRGASLQSANLAGANLMEADLVEAKLEGADLGGADIEGADLEGADLEAAKLEGADLRGANLKRALLAGAKLAQANLEGANLEGDEADSADLHGAHLKGATLSLMLLEYANLEGADLQAADLQGAELERSHLNGADLHGADLAFVELHGASAENVDLEGANLEEAQLEGTNLRGANAKGALLQDALLREANLEGVDLEGTNLVEENFDEADLKGANLRGAKLEGADLEGTDLEGANLKEADLSGANLARVDLAALAPPTASIESPAAGAVYAGGQLVATTFSCVEGESGPLLEPCRDSNGGSGTSGTLNTVTPGSHTYTVTATGTDGQQVETSISYTVLPRQPQSLSFLSSAPANPTVGSIYPVAANASSALAVSFSIDPSSTVGTCSLAGGTVSFTGAGSCVIDANQSGSVAYSPAQQQRQTIAVTTKKAATVTTLALTRSSVAYAGEQAETAELAITSAGGGVIPSASITVKSGTTVLCTAAITNGIGSCSMTATALLPGARSLAASYGGTARFLASKSAASPLTVVKEPSSTSLSLSAPSAQWGSEQSEAFTVGVTAEGGVTATGTVLVKAGALTLCTVTLSGGTGKCSPTATKLPKLTRIYPVLAVYSGSTTLAAATSSSASLEILP